MCLVLFFHCSFDLISDANKKYFVDNDYMEREKLFCVSSKIRFFLQKGNEIGKKARSEFFDKVATIRHQNGKILPATISHENKNSRLTYNMKYE